MMRTLSALFTAGFLLAAHPAAGGPLPTLKDSATVDGEFVRLGDLIDNVGSAAHAPVFRAPELGGTGTIQVYRIIEAARTNGVSVFDTRGVSEVVVMRAARTISIPELERAVAETAAKQTGMAAAGDIAVAFDASVSPLAVEPNAASTPRIVQFNYDTRTQRFNASMDVPGSNAARRRAMRVSGYLYETAEIPVLTHPMNRGEVVRDDDVQMVRRARADLTPDTVRNTGALVGQAARRDLRAEIPIRTPELMKPELVGRGDMVTLVFEGPGVRLTVRGRAVDAGTEGDVIQVVNPQSKRTVQATVEGPGRVVVRTAKTASAASIETTGSLK